MEALQAMASPAMVRYEKSEIVVMRRGDVVDKQESERVTDGRGSIISSSPDAPQPNKGISTAEVQLLSRLDDAAEPRAGGAGASGPDKVRVARLLDPLKLGAIASTAFGAFLFASKRDVRSARAFWPRSPLLPAVDDGSRLDPHLVALNALLGAAYMSLGAAQGVMSLSCDRGPRRLFHLWNVAQTLLNQLTVTRCRRRGFADQPANIMLGIFGTIGAWSLSKFFRGGRKKQPKRGAGKQQAKKGQQQQNSGEQDSDIFLA